MNLTLSPEFLCTKRKHPGPPLVIAGPCSVESEGQIVAIARALAGCKVDMLRGGIWKPRTRPGSFEGVGEQGLPWIKNAGHEAGIPTAVEVATPDHVEQSLKHGIDCLWIGARTTVNPFAVQAIADALRGVDLPVMVKNPVNPDLDLWVGALERLNRAGVTRLAAIHRGFSSYRRTEYRNVPNWRIPIELKRIAPTLPLICDPSHICGNTHMIEAVSQEALDLLFDGLMIEVHNNPAVALSDGKQQLTPEQLCALVNKLTVRQQTAKDEGLLRKMARLRKEVDDVDTQIIHLLAQRMGITNTIGAAKKQSNVASYQPDRWEEILQSRTKSAIDQKLGRDFIVQVYQLIHEEAIRQQEE